MRLRGSAEEGVRASSCWRPSSGAGCRTVTAEGGRGEWRDHLPTEEVLISAVSRHAPSQHASPHLLQEGKRMGGGEERGVAT